jgi:hypothetical protein
VASKNNLLKRSRRELTASPKKAAVLGVSFVIAIWFWAPLVGKWFGVKSTEEAAVAPASADEVVATITTVTPTAAKPTPKWHQVLEWMRKDPLMQPYRPSANERDPFAPSEAQIAKHEESQPAATAPPELTPQQAGLALRSTVIGPHMKTALINGRAYHERQSILAANGRDRFVLVEIRNSSIVLKRNGQTFELKLPRVEATTTED